MRSGLSMRSFCGEITDPFSGVPPNGSLIVGGPEASINGL